MEDKKSGCPVRNKKTDRTIAFCRHMYFCRHRTAMERNPGEEAALLQAENPAGKDSFLTDRMEMVHTAY